MPTLMFKCRLFGRERGIDVVSPQALVSVENNLLFEQVLTHV